jgi:hypothetical protein
MREVGKVKLNFVRRKAASAIIIWLLVASILLVVVPLESPGTEALLYHSGGSASYEDGDFGGGLDYNGDPAGDNKVTWHAANNSHIIDQNFFVNDGYILEIEAGVDLKLDPNVVLQVGTAGIAWLYCNGTMGSFITISENVSLSPWQGIFVVFGSYCSIEYTTITGGGIVYVEGSTLDMSVSGISIMNSFGIYSTDSTVTVSGSVIVFTAQPGIYALDSTLSLTGSFISDTLGPAVRCDNTNATIDNCDLYGFNASGGSGGGHAVYLTGKSSLITISNNTIVGGRGGDNPGGGAGSGGFGIFDINYDGRVRIIDNDLIQGGRGGNNMLNGEVAGAGGYAVHFFPVADYSSPPAIEIANNPLLFGGGGGDNLAAMGGTAGDGGHALRISDDAGKGGDIVLSGNINVVGGIGGRNDATWGAGGWQAGAGGDGISIENCQSPGSALVSLNPNTMGGRGGNTTNTGTPGTLPQAGEGGNGIIIFQSNGVTMDQNVFTGGAGGDNTAVATSTRPGDGGIGVFVYSDNPPGSGADISSSTITGGNGGINLAPSQVSGRGGNGLTSGGFWGSSGSAVNCDITGGEGGSNAGSGGRGGAGGYSSSFSSSTGWLISGGSMIGGKGGDNTDIRGGGGSGNTSLLIVSACDDITINGLITVVGGAGGDADVGDLGPGSAAQTSIYLGGSSNLNILASNITVGTGGFNATSGSFGQNGSFCIYGTGLGGLNTISGNDITTNENIAGKYAINLDSSSVIISDNDIYNSYVGVYFVNCNGVSVGSLNNIYNNFIGIYLLNSDPSSSSGNMIEGNGYGIYCINSNPTITEDIVLDSTTTGVFLDTGSAPTFEGVRIEDSAGYNVYCNGGAAPNFYNSTLIQTVGTGEFYMTGNSHPWLLNTTFDKTALVFGDVNSNITVNWYMHVRVVDTGYTPVSGAAVWINDTFGTNIDTRITDGQGWSNFIVVTEYIESVSGYDMYYSPHNVDVWEGGRYGVTQPIMSQSKVVIVMLEGAGFDLLLKSGWNMISIPVEQSSTLLADVLAPISGLYNAVQWYDAGGASDPWKHYHINKGGLNDLSDIDRTMGIWLHMKTDAVFPILGPVPLPSTTDIMLTKGWNYVGYPSFTKRTAGNDTGEAFESLKGNLDMIQFYDAGDPGNPWKAWDYGSYSQDDLTSIKPGYGLWIHMTANDIWSVDW